MPDYHYQRYINRAFWNSLVAVLCALVLVLIIVYGREAIRGFMTELVADRPAAEEAEADQLELLESLRSPETASEGEMESPLDELRSGDGETADDEQLEHLESLRQP